MSDTTEIDELRAAIAQIEGRLSPKQILPSPPLPAPGTWEREAYEAQKRRSEEYQARDIARRAEEARVHHEHVRELRGEIRRLEEMNAELDAEARPIEEERDGVVAPIAAPYNARIDPLRSRIWNNSARIRDLAQQLRKIGG